VRIMEIDVDDLPWKYDLVTTTPRIVDGHMTVPTVPGWGADLNEEVARAHPPGALRCDDSRQVWNACPACPGMPLRHGWGMIAATKAAWGDECLWTPL